MEDERQRSDEPPSPQWTIRLLPDLWSRALFAAFGGGGLWLSFTLWLGEPPRGAANRIMSILVMVLAFVFGVFALTRNLECQPFLVVDVPLQAEAEL